MEEHRKRRSIDNQYLLLFQRTSLCGVRTCEHIPAFAGCCQSDGRPGSGRRPWFCLWKHSGAAAATAARLSGQGR